MCIRDREYRDAGHPADVTAGLLLEVTQWYPSERSRASFVDEDEIDGLLRGIDYILQNATSEVTRFSNFEVRYRTKGGFGVAAFSSGETIGVVFQSGDVQYSFGRLVHLWQLRELIVRAQALLRKDA